MKESHSQPSRLVGKSVIESKGDWRVKCKNNVKGSRYRVYYIVDAAFIHKPILYKTQAKNARACLGYFSIWFLLNILQNNYKRAGFTFVHFMKLMIQMSLPQVFGCKILGFCHV